MPLSERLRADKLHLKWNEHHHLDKLELRWGRLLIAAVLVGIVGGGCAGDDASAEAIFIPRHHVSGGPTALIRGVLHLQDRCIWLETPERLRDLVIWPESTRFEADAGGRPALIGVPGTSTPLPIGSFVELGGGEYKDQAFIRDTIGGDLPQACISERYWLATSATTP